MSIKNRISTFVILLCAMSACLKVKAQVDNYSFQAMCIIQVNGQSLMETCNITESRDGQWRRGIRVIAPVHNYEMKDGTFSGCPDNKSTWDSVSRECYRFSWSAEPLPGNNNKKCPQKNGFITPCKLMISENLMIRITPHILVQGLTFG